MLGMRAHKFATARLSDPSIKALLEVLLEGYRNERADDEPTGQELDRLKLYRRLMEPTIGRQVKHVAEAGAFRLRNMLGRWRATRERSLLQFAEPKNLAN